MQFLCHSSKKAIEFSPSNLQDANLVNKANQQDLMFRCGQNKLYGRDWKLRMDKNNKTNVWTAVNHFVQNQGQNQGQIQGQGQNQVKPYFTKNTKDLLRFIRNSYEHREKLQIKVNFFD
jgi:hypothetical protein